MPADIFQSYFQNICCDARNKWAADTGHCGHLHDEATQFDIRVASRAHGIGSNCTRHHQPYEFRRMTVRQRCWDLYLLYWWTATEWNTGCGKKESMTSSCTQYFWVCCDLMDCCTSSVHWAVRHAAGNVKITLLQMLKVSTETTVASPDKLVQWPLKMVTCVPHAGLRSCIIGWICVLTWWRNR